MNERFLTMPRFSIIITCYNQVKFIRDAVDSALAQNYANKEVIVVDDCSVDKSKKILAEYGDAIKLKALETNQGACAARNWGVSLATGDFLVFLDGDDLLLPWALNVYRHIVNVKNPKLLLCNIIWFKDTFSSVKNENISRGITVVEYEAYMKKDRAFRVSASALVVDRLCFDNVGGWTKNLFPMDDYDFLLKLGYSGCTIQIVSPETVAYRVHENNTIHQVERIVDSVFKLIWFEKMGRYPGGRACRSERYSILGGIIFYWFKKALVMKKYAKGLKLLIDGMPMVITAIYRRIIAIIKGRCPQETLKIVVPLRVVK